MQYEDKLRKALMYLADKIEWPLFFDQLVKVIDIWEELKTHDDTLKPIVNKWGRREKEITLLCYLVINSSHDHVEKLYDIANDLSDFDNRRVSLQLKFFSYLNKYKNQKFDLFPCALDRKKKLKNKEEWSKELDDLFCTRINKVINEKGHAWWATMTKEKVKVQLFFDSLKEEFVDFEKEASYILKKQNDILQFSWPDDIQFDTWMADLLLDKQLEEDSLDDDEKKEGEVQVIDTLAPKLKKEEGEKVIMPAQGESSENPQEKTDLEVSQDHPSLASLVATYSEEPK